MLSLDSHVTIPWDDRDYKWKEKFYDLVPENTFQIVGGMTDPDGNPYASATLPGLASVDNAEKTKSFPELIDYCMKRHCGLAFVMKVNSDMPDALLRFGSIWSYYEYQNLAGCANVVDDYKKAYQITPECPFDALISESQAVYIGQPSNEFFPPYMRDILTEEIEKYFPAAKPSFHLLNQEKYAMPFSIMVQLHCPIEPQQMNTLRNKLLWFMPPYLPISIQS